MKLTTSIKTRDVRQLERMFAKLTPHGWVTPKWIVDLKQHCILRDLKALKRS